MRHHAKQQTKISLNRCSMKYERSCVPCGAAGMPPSAALQALGKALHLTDVLIAATMLTAYPKQQLDEGMSRLVVQIATTCAGHVRLGVEISQSKD